MIKTSFLMLVALPLLNLSAFAQDSNLHIYLCFGQSNMDGAGPLEPQDAANVDERFRVLSALDFPKLKREKGNWYTAVPPLCRPSSGISPADYFGRTLVANLPAKVRVGVVNVAVPGCKIELFDKDNYATYAATAPDWMKNMIAGYEGNPYQYLVKMAKLAQKDGVIKGILLHQGESNTGDKQWPSKVKGVYDNLIKDLDLNPANVPLLAGEVVAADQNGACASMNAIIDDLPKTLPNSYAISAAGCTARPDRLHFDAAGYRELGKRYGEKMLSLLGVSVASTTPNVAAAALGVSVASTTPNIAAAAVGVTGATTQPNANLTLKDAYKDHFAVGVAINRTMAMSGNDTSNKDVALVKEQYNQISPENDLKWESIHPREGADGYNFGPADAFVDFGVKNNMMIVGHTLVWHGQTPAWVFSGTHTSPAPAAAPGNGANGGRRRGFDMTAPHASREELLARMREHIHTVMGRYKGKIKVWDVVNEALSDGGPNVLRVSPWQQIIGDDFIEKAFEYAHEADPDAILRYNDYSLENPAKRQKLITLIKGLQAKKVPVMAIGTQTHVSASSPSVEEEDRALTEMEALGLPVHVTELDVNSAQGGQNNTGADVANNAATTQGGLISDTDKRLADQYANLFKLFIKHKSVTMVTFWGVNDGVSWRAAGKPLLFDANNQPKPAFNAVIQAAQFTPNQMAAPVVPTAVENSTWKPATSNQDGKPFPQVDAEGRVRARVVAPQAHTVQLDIGGVKYPLTKGEDGSWIGDSQPQDEGFHYYQIVIDGAQVPDPNSLYYYGASRWGSGIEVPAKDQDFYALKNVPHGQLREVHYFSKTSNSVRRCYIYTPPGYDNQPRKRFPVLYLQHGGGENETGWGNQGRTGAIMDNLIAAGQAKPFIIVMENGSNTGRPAPRPATPPTPSGAAPNPAPRPGAGPGGRRFDFSGFERIMIDDLIPFVDANYRTVANRENRAMAGLSMGGMQTRSITLAHPETFSQIGVFSGGSIAPTEIADMNAYKKQMEMVFFSFGGRETGGAATAKANAAALKAAGINSHYYESPLTGHEWQSWRRSLHQFAQLVFKN